MLLTVMLVTALLNLPSVTHEWVPTNVAEAYYMMGPTAVCKRSNTHKVRTRPGYHSKQFYCCVPTSTMRWLLQASDWDDSCQFVFVQPSQEKHNNHDKTTWDGHF
jgi:hypothetical protein